MDRGNWQAPMGSHKESDMTEGTKQQQKMRINSSPRAFK